MKKVARAALAATLMLAVAAFAPGCAENNESTANVKGAAPPEGTYPKSQADMQAAMKGGAGAMPKNYPGGAKANAKAQ